VRVVTLLSCPYKLQTLPVNLQQYASEVRVFGEATSPNTSREHTTRKQLIHILNTPKKSFTPLYTSIANYKNFELFIGLYKDLEKISTPFTTKDPQKSMKILNFLTKIWRNMKKPYFPLCMTSLDFKNNPSLPPLNGMRFAKTWNMIFIFWLCH